MKTKVYYTKKMAEKEFRVMFAEEIASKDAPLIRQTWNWFTRPEAKIRYDSSLPGCYYYTEDESFELW